MFRYNTCLIFLVFICTEPVFGAVANNKINNCSVDQFSCGDGSCIALNSLCDGVVDCTDYSDERACSGLGDAVFKWERVKRQASSCRKNQWQCRDGTCIGFDGKCDGAVDCPDGSDETFPLCRKTQCQSNWFRCTYGACVDGSAPCNGVRDCADNSDELLPRCRNETDEARGKFKCANGQVIPSAEHCDGVRDCADGSDETLQACAATSCPGYLFQCAYGACVDQGSDCNGKQECADGSDESDELCNRNSPGVKPVTPTFAPPTNKPAQGGKCALPPYPQFGKYRVSNIPGAGPGEAYPSVVLNVTCNPGFGVEGMKDTIWCYDGVWSDALPRCVRFCRLNKHPSVEYRCISTGAFTGSRECGPLEPAGTIVQPICRTPNYYFPGVLSDMNCIDGYWDYIALCKPGLRDLTNITITINDTIQINISTNNINNIVINNYADNNVKVNSANGNRNDNVKINNSNPNDKVKITVANKNDNVKINANNNFINDKNKNKNSANIVYPEDNPGFNINLIPKEQLNNVKTTTDNVYNKYEIDEGDWSIGQAQPVKPQNG